MTPSERTIRVLIGGSDWFELQRAPPKSIDDDASRQAVTRRLEGALLSERLLFLLGSGASRGIVGEPAAPMMSDLWDEVARARHFDVAAALVPAQVRRAKDIERLLSAVQASLSLHSDSKLRQFLEAAEQAIVRRCQFVKADTALPAHQALFRRIAGRPTRQARAQIFTTNYDLALEEAASRTNFKLVDGFEPRVGGRFDGTYFDTDFVRRRQGEALELETNVAHLLKIHGSVDWDATDSGLRKSAAPQAPCLIYPAEDKFRLSYDPPYLECLARFQMSLRERDVSLIAAGFGFNDAHIAAPIRAAIQANSGLRLVIVSPRCDTDANVNVAFARALALAGDARIALFACDFESFVSLIPDISGRDEREVHAERLASVEAGTGRA